jgi:hypothetical protein
MHARYAPPQRSARRMRCAENSDTMPWSRDWHFARMMTASPTGTPIAVAKAAAPEPDCAPELVTGLDIFDLE